MKPRDLDRACLLGARLGEDPARPGVTVTITSALVRLDELVREFFDARDAIATVLPHMIDAACVRLEQAETALRTAVQS